MIITAKMPILSFQYFLFFLILIYLRNVHGSNSGDGGPKIRCIEVERLALLKLRHDFQAYEQGKSLLSSWGNEEEKRECCKWVGIRCDNRSGHVIKLDLSPSTFGRNAYTRFGVGGNISSSLLELLYLNDLDLSALIFFGNSRIPSFIGSLTKLRYLNLSGTYLSGEIPPQLGNLSNLQFLDLGFNNILTAKSLEWLSRLTNLEHLNLRVTNLSRAYDWMQMVNQLPYLTNLQLMNCKLPDIAPSSLSLANSSKTLAMLDLSYNNLSVSLYQWLFNISHSLVLLDLSSNHLKGPIPQAFGNMFDHLLYLDLSDNKFEGSIPDSLGNITALAYLDLSQNMFENEIPESIWKIPALRTFYVDSNNLSGQLPESIGQLSQLENLGISRNFFEGVISEAHFSKLFNLHHLDLSYNSFTLSISSDWIPSFNLDVILLGSCNLGPQFPKWLQNQKNYSQLDISNTRIHDSVPNWFWDLPTKLFYLNLSNNYITGTIPISFTEWIMSPEIDLTSNQFEGSIPPLLFRAAALHLSGNKFSDLNSLCTVTGDLCLSLLDISNNELSGQLPDCWSRFKGLSILNLDSNKLSGEIPASIGSLDQLLSLHLGKNSFRGKLPSSLKNCTNLMVIDVGENILLGEMPTWIGESLQNLVILILRSNQLNGSSLSHLCHLSNMQLLDLSSNTITGAIPRCFNNFTAMKTVGNIEATISHLYLSLGSATSGVAAGRYYEDEVDVVWKGTLSEYKKTLKLVKSIDLSNNKMTGEIPSEITELVGLVSLNLSRNDLSGQLPPEIGKLKSLDALDLSNNHLLGAIPSSLSQVDRLSLLDLSNNNLSGKIPTGTQLQSFNANAYMGNSELCGAPLPKKCPGEEPASSSTDTEAVVDQDDQDSYISQGFYISIGLGFVAGFWGFWGMLLFKKSWRYSYIKFLNDASDWIFARAAVF